MSENRKQMIESKDIQYDSTVLQNGDLRDSFTPFRSIVNVLKLLSSIFLKE